MSRMMARGTPTKIQRRRWRPTLTSLDRHPSYPVDVLIFVPPLVSHMPPRSSGARDMPCHEFDRRFRNGLLPVILTGRYVWPGASRGGPSLPRAWHVPRKIGVKEGRDDECTWTTQS